MKYLIAALLFLGFAPLSMAAPTKVVVRVKAKDAKFIGTGIGGALVIIRNSMTSEILAKGLTEGSSGSTALLLQTPLKRGQSITDATTARFEAVVDIEDPVLAEVEVVAPVTRRNATIKGSTQLWLIPGKNIEGDGLVIELPGFILDIIRPGSHQQINIADIKDNVFDFRISLTMLCGCTITKGGVWNSEHIEVVAIVRKDGIKIKEVPLVMSDEANLFDGRLEIKGKGLYQLSVYAYDRKTYNTGFDQVNFVVQ